MSKFKEKIPYIIGAIIGAVIFIVFLVYGIFGDQEMGQAFKASPLWMKIIGLGLWGVGGYVGYKTSRDELPLSRQDNTNMFIVTGILFLTAVFGLLFLLGFYSSVL